MLREVCSQINRQKNKPADGDRDQLGRFPGVCGAAERKVKMSTGVLIGSLPAVLFLSTLLGTGPGAFAQTTERPIVTIVASDHHAAEAEQDVGVFTVSRTGATEASLLVFYELSGTARNGVDYLELPRTITIPAGAASASITVKPIDDSLAEGTETVVATLVPSPTLSPIEPYRVGFPSSDVILLADNDSPNTNPPPSVRILSPTNDATFVAPATIHLVARAEPISQVHSVEFFAGADSLGWATFEPARCAVCPVWALDWSNVFAGEYTVTAKATEEPGASAVSEPVRIAVKDVSAKPVVTIEATDPLASEIPEVPPGMGLPQRYDPAQFTVWRTGSTAAALEVRYRIEGTAENGVDYRKLSGVVRIPSGSAFGRIEVSPIDDGDVEATETVVVILVPNDCDSSPPPAGCYAVGEPSQATASIQDNDTTPHSPPTVAILRPTDGAAFVGPARIEITATAQASGAWIREVEFFAGDRRLGVVNFNVFLDSFRFIWNDIPAGEYTLTAKATDSLGATAWSGPAHITVKSGDASPIVLVSKGSIWKYLDDGSDQGAAWRAPGFNDAEWRSGPAQLGFGDGNEATVLRAGNEERRFVTYYFRRALEIANVEGISALKLRLLRDDGAVVYLNGHEVFRSNLPDGPIRFNTLALQAVEPDGENVFHPAGVDTHLLVNGRNVLAVEVHQVSTESPDASFDLELVGSAATAAPVVNIEATDAEAAEISPLVGVPPNPAVFKVTRTGETSKALRVYYRLAGTARNGVDYQELPGSVTIPVGAASAEIVVQPIDDALVEGKESVVATIVPFFLIDPSAGSDPYAVGSNAAAEAHILDNDELLPNALPAVKIAQPTGGSTFAAPATISIVAEVRDPDGWVGLVAFFANERKIGERSVVFVREPDPGQVQSFSFEWKEVPHGEYTLVAKATDNRAGQGASDPVRVRVGEATPQIPVVTIFARDAIASEGTNSSGEINTATFVVRRTGETNAGLTVFLSVHGTAENGVDYEALPNSVTIPAGRHTAPIVVKPIRDGQKELLETVLLALEADPSLGPIARYKVGQPSKAAAAIADSDQPPPAGLRTADGLFHLCLPGENGFGYRLECSTDLARWLPLCTNVVTDGAVHFVDADADGHSRRFYRVLPERNVDLDD